ncbi:DUF6569 family protein [Methanosphaera cuniculi]|uniref:ARPP-1 family domain-containing protein n=1 Tax=Methanosphaera cuniculi TaxID=1077256 RepID=UPI0026ECB851|nr:DUF6569 family protein [Methanosphaera cuniculi]
MTKINLKKLFDNFEYTSIQSYENISIIGIKSNKNYNNIDILPLKKGLQMGLVKISELENASVNKLNVINNAITPLLILDGEELIGAKQNRIVNATYIIPPKTTMKIEVSCTEEGRWKYTTNHFKYSGHFAESKLRKAKAQDVTKSLKKSKTRKSNQARIWNRISKVSDNLDVKSETSAMREIYTNNKAKINKYLENLKDENDTIGSIILINNEVSGIELLFNTILYKENHKKLIESYIPEAIERKNENYNNKSIDVDEFINKIITSKTQQYKPEGIGVDVRVESEDIIGSTILLENNPINASFFRKIKK